MYTTTFQPEKSGAALLLENELIQQSRGGANIEPQTAAMFEAMLQMDDEPKTQLLNIAGASTIEARRINRGAAASLFRTALVSYFTDRYLIVGQRRFHDIDRSTADDWEVPFKILHRDLAAERVTPQLEKFMGSLMLRTTASPVKERYMPVELVGQMAKDRYPDGIRALDFGCSIGVGGLQLLYKGEYPMQFREVTAEIPGSAYEISLIEPANELLRDDPVFKSVVGVDYIPYYDERTRLYDRDSTSFAICGLRPGERSNDEYMDELHDLISKKDLHALNHDLDAPHKFVTADLLNNDELEKFKSEQNPPFDMIISSFVTQELATEKQIRLHNILCDELLSDAGILAYVHPAYLKRGDTAKRATIYRLRTHGTFARRPYRTKMHIFDKLNPDAGLQEVMEFYDNRCREARVLQSGKLVVGEYVSHIADLLLQSQA